MFDLIISTLTQGFIYALLSYGIYITYKILDFPDLTVDGSFPLGAAIAAVLLVKGMNPFVALLAAILVGAVAGLVTGIIHVKFGVRDLLAGIITMTALFSINLQIAGSNLAVERAIDTIFTSGPIMTIMGNSSLMMRKFVMSLIVALIFKFILDWYLSTKSGMLLRAVGDNSTLVTTLAKDKGIVKIVGLVVANALVALSGAMVCMEQRAFSSTMGTGQMVFGLAAVIIGTTLFRKLSFAKGTTAVLVGSVFYKACIQVAISLGLPANLMKLATAVLFLVVLVLGNKQKGGAERA
ncbi:ABC transporter permease [Anaerotignum sp.]|nr:ABC transporter permease [Anaerotignum sp.]MBQ7757542.1 ABC transporter permease [Anaerotignum sp.]